MTEPVDKFVWRGWLTAWSIGVASIATGWEWLAAPAGVLIVAIGVTLAMNVRGVQGRLREREERSKWSVGKGTPVASTYGGVVIALIGLGWIYVGLGNPFG